MKIQTFIADHLKARLEKHAALVVYDPEGLYRDIVMGMAGKDCTVIDGALSTIEGRETALDVWRRLGEDETGKARMVIYLPISKPVTDVEKRRNPYEIFAMDAKPFPDSDGEAYQALCRRAAPDLTAAIDSLFAEGAPDFETVNNLFTGGGNWPKLKTLLKVESALEILVALMSPSDAQATSLDKDAGWVTELKTLLGAALGMTLLTRSHKAGPIREEIWRYVLFSEFVLDLPGDLPASLKDVPRAPDACRDLIYGICDTLRRTETHQQKYMDMAEKIAADLNLAARMEQVRDLGVRDTFAFEERTFLNLFSDAALMGRYDEALAIMQARRNSIWVRHTSERMQLWTLGECAFKLLTAGEDLETPLHQTGDTLSALVDFYVTRFRAIDCLHRWFEQAFTDAAAPIETLEKLVDAARKKNRDLAGRLHSRFMDAVSREGWPAAGIPRHTEVFDKYVAPWLKERKKVALFMVDALRYELAVELESRLAGDYKVGMNVVCAQLPTITPVGMAALLPEAAGNLRLVHEKDTLLPYIKDRKILTPNDRYEYVRSLYGDLCAMRDLDELVDRASVRPSKTTRLLIVKTTDIDKIGELKPHLAFDMMPRLIRNLITGIRRVQDAGFDHAVIATDHGFVLMDAQLAGDAVEAPPGEWILKKRRCLLGKGSTGHGVLVMDKNTAGIAGDFEHLAVPRSFGTFVRGNPYFHEGVSLQECLLPVIQVEFGRAAPQSVNTEIDIAISYKKGTTDRVTTRRPMIEIMMYKTMFDETIDFQLIAYAGKEIVGEPAACPHVHPATNLVSIKPGQAIKVPLKMAEDFHGEFEVRAVNPETRANYATMKLITDYLD